MKRKYFLAVVFVCNMIAYQANAQIDFPTPNAASLGQFGQIPVSYFNGLPNISVPLYELKYKDIKIPIALQYHSGGIRPEDHPGWVGLGWNLQAGGAVTRIVNGIPDETDETLKNGAFPKFGYFFHSSDLDVTDWASNAGLDRYRQTYPLPYDAEPDEFMFSAGDFSGSFYMSRDKQNKIIVKVKSNGNEDLKIIPELGSSRITYQFFKLPGSDITANGLRNATLDWPTFSKFTIIRPNGMQYVFGGAPGDLSAVDLTSSPASNYTYIVPTTWYLTKIVSPNGYAVSLTYKKQGDPVVRRDNKTKTYLYLPNSNIPSESSDNQKGVSYVIMHPSYLAKIITPDNNEVEFVTSKATQLDYDFVTDYTPKAAFDPVMGGGGWPFNATSSYNYSDYCYYLKLDAIKVKNLKTIAFNYIENTNQRLRLDGVSCRDAAVEPPKDIFTYKFVYNPTYLPPYNSMKTDNWGYYNGKSYKDFVINYATYIEDLYAFRSPDQDLMKSEMLEKIIYPTGGSTQFIYEPHTYSKRATQHPFGLVANNGTAGGLRIRTIISKSGDNVTNPLTKEYLYEDETGKSNGILSGIPIYHTQGIQRYAYSYASWSGLVYFRSSTNYTQAYDIFSADPLGPLSSTNGSHITYSKVTEQMSDGTKTEYVYSNHETMSDENFVNTMQNFEGLVVTNPFISKELERGLLLSATHYKAGNLPVSKTVNEYNDDPARYNDYVKSITNETIEGVASLPSFNRFTAKKIYTFSPYLKKSTEFAYDPAGQNPLATTKEHEYYAGCRRIKSVTQTDSKQQTIQTQYKYPSEYNGTAVYDAMVKNNILPVIEQVTTKGTTTELSKTQTNYAFWNNNTLTLPDNIKKAVLGNNPETEITFTKYDIFGNPLEYATKDGIITAILWGYNGQYPVAKIIGSSYDIAKAKIDPNILDNPLGDDQARSELSKLRAIPNALVTTYTYMRLVGMTSETDPNGRTTYYGYDGLGRLTYVRDKDNNIIRKICYNYSGQPEDCMGRIFTSTKSQSFTKNNCGNCSVGSAVLYTATATSTLSQPDADAKAQADIDANGQSYANQNGSCTSSLNNVPTGINASSQVSLTSFSAATSNNITTMSLVFYPTINVVPNSPFQIGVLSNSCYSSLNSSVLVTAGGVAMQLICDHGKVYIQTVSQTINAYTTISITNAAIPN